VNTITLKEVKIGDEFNSVQYGKICPTGGTISKIGRVNLEFSGLYMGRHLVTGIKLPKQSLVGGLVKRSGVLYNVTQ
jgi:hypothetical protein